MKIVVVLLLAAVWLPSIAHSQDAHCSDAELLALENSDSLSPPAELTAAIDADLQAIRELGGVLAEIRVLPSWAPSVLSVHLTPAAMQEFRAGTYHGFDELNEQYGPVTMRGFTQIDFVTIQFEPCYNSPQLIPLYIGAPGVIDIYTSGIVGDGDDISILEPGRYLLEHGWDDCLSGCLFHHFWVITVESGVVRIVEEYGDPIATRNATWGEVKSLYR